MGNIDACGRERTKPNQSIAEVCCQKIENELKLNKVSFLEVRSALLHYGPDVNLTSNQFEEFLAKINIDRDTDYRDTTKPLLCFFQNFVDLETQEYKQDMLFKCGILMSKDSNDDKCEDLWWYLQKSHIGFVNHRELQSTVNLFLQIAARKIPELTINFNKCEEEALVKLKWLSNITDSEIENYATEILDDIKLDKGVINLQIDEKRFKNFMISDKASIIFNTTSIRDHILKNFK